MGTMASQITSLTIAYSSVYSGADQRKHQSSASLAFVRGIHQSPVNSPPKEPVTRIMFQFGDVIAPPRRRTYLGCVEGSHGSVGERRCLSPAVLPTCLHRGRGCGGVGTSDNTAGGRRAKHRISLTDLRTVWNHIDWGLIQWNLSIMTTFVIKFITCDLFRNVF